MNSNNLLKDINSGFRKNDSSINRLLALLENIYEEALIVEFAKNDFKFERQKEIKVRYLDVEIGTHRLDLVVENEIVVELKAVKEFSDIHFAQLRSYLKATGLKVGLLLNFGKPTLEIKRIVN